MKDLPLTVSKFVKAFSAEYMSASVTLVISESCSSSSVLTAQTMVSRSASTRTRDAILVHWIARTSRAAWNGTNPMTKSMWSPNVLQQDGRCAATCAKSAEWELAGTFGLYGGCKNTLIATQTSLVQRRRGVRRHAFASTSESVPRLAGHLDRQRTKLGRPKVQGE